MNDPNYDARLEPKYRERTTEEIDEIVRSEWRKKLEKTRAEKLLLLLPAHMAHDYLEQIIDDILDNCDPKFADPHFYKSLDWGFIRTEER
jgi:hypothetical protein